MLDIFELDNSLKLKALGKMLNCDHPMLNLIRNKINMSDFFHPNLETGIDNFSSKAIQLLRNDRRNMLENVSFGNMSKVRMLLGESWIKNWIRKDARGSLIVFNLRVRGIVKIRDLTRPMLAGLRPIMAANDGIWEMFKRIVPINIILRPTEEDKYLYPINNGLQPLQACTSRAIRLSRQDKEQICIFKIGLVLTPTESKTWLFNLKKLTSTAHKNAILRAAHSEIYSRERLFRFGLAADPYCTRCGEVENVEHKLFNCRAIRNLWIELGLITEDLLLNGPPNVQDIQRCVGAFTDTNVAYLTIHAELLLRIMRNQHLTETRHYIRTLLSHLIKKETNIGIKLELTNLFDSYF